MIAPPTLTPIGARVVIANSSRLPQITSAGNGQSNNPVWCSIHEYEMKHWEKDGRVWYSHQVKGASAADIITGLTDSGFPIM